jgi:hypothetical protein
MRQKRRKRRNEIGGNQKFELRYGERRWALR